MLNLAISTLEINVDVAFGIICQGVVYLITFFTTKFGDIFESCDMQNMFHSIYAIYSDESMTLKSRL